MNLVESKDSLRNVIMGTAPKWVAQSQGVWLDSSESRNDKDSGYWSRTELSVNLRGALAEDIPRGIWYRTTEKLRGPDVLIGASGGFPGALRYPLQSDTSP